MKKYYLLALLFTISLSTFAQQDTLVTKVPITVFKYIKRGFAEVNQLEVTSRTTVVRLPNPTEPTRWFLKINQDTVMYEGDLRLCTYSLYEYKNKRLDEVKDSLFKANNQTLKWTFNTFCGQHTVVITNGEKINDTFIFRELSLNSYHDTVVNFNTISATGFISFNWKELELKTFKKSIEEQYIKLCLDSLDSLKEEMYKIQIGETVYLRYFDFGTPYKLIKIETDSKEIVPGYKYTSSFSSLTFQNIKTGEVYFDKFASRDRSNYFTKQQINSFKTTFGVNWQKASNGEPWLGMSEKQFLKYPEFFGYSSVLERKSTLTTTSAGKVKVYYAAENQSLTFTNGILTKIIE